MKLARHAIIIITFGAITLGRSYADPSAAPVLRHPSMAPKAAGLIAPVKPQLKEKPISVPAAHQLTLNKTISKPLPSTIAPSRTAGLGGSMTATAKHAAGAIDGTAVIRKPNHL